VHDDVIPLHLLAAGQFAQVDQLFGDAALVHRLEEMGVRSGTTVEMVQSGLPCIIRLGGQKLCFRSSEACNVLVRPGSSQ
jgi:ferrous iron transport protein A